MKLDGLEKPVDWDTLFSVPKDYWLDDTHESKAFFRDQVGCDLPKVIAEELSKQEERINKM